jgi:hypothetical protein
MNKITFLKPEGSKAVSQLENTSEQSPSLILPLGRNQKTPSISMFHALGSMFKVFRLSHFSLLLLSSMFLALCSTSFAQGNLQFNQVFNLSGGVSSTSNSPGLSQLQTVPSGKVWKIEHVGSNATTASCTNSYYGLKINNGITTFLEFFSTGNIGKNYNICPIWLKESDNLQFVFNNGCANNLSISYVISIIEFNVVP